MKTLEDIRNEVLLLHERGIDNNAVVFYGDSKEGTRAYILFQKKNTKKVVKIMEDNSEVVTFFTITGLGKTLAYKACGDEVTRHRTVI